MASVSGSEVSNVSTVISNANSEGSNATEQTTELNSSVPNNLPDVAAIYNFITENKIHKFVDLPTEPASPQPILTMADLPFYGNGAVSWSDMPVDLETEFDYLRSIGFAVAQNERNYINRTACEKLYGVENGIFAGEEVSEKKKAELRGIYAMEILPTYARMTAVLAEGLPDSTYDGRRARELASEIQTVQTRLELL